MTNISITVTENVSASFLRAAAALDDLTPIMQKIAASGATDTAENFKGQHSPLGVPWARHAEGYKNRTGRILDDTGDLRQSIIAEAGKDFAAWGPQTSAGAAVYAKIHQFGGKISAKAGSALNTPFGPRKSVTMPARPYLGWNDGLKSRAIDAIADHVKTIFSQVSGAV